MVEKSRVEKFLLALGLKSSGLKGLGLKLGVEKSGVEMSFNRQTAGKKHPYVFSQCQAIHARSMVPCQDSPSVKASYTAEVTRVKLCFLYLHGKCYFELIKLTKFSTQTKPPFTFDGHDTGFP